MANFGIGAQYDWQNAIVALPIADLFNPQFNVVSTLQGALLQYPISFIQALGVALLRLDVNLPDQLDNQAYGMVSITVDECFQAIATAVNSGFTHGVVLGGGTRMAATHHIIRKAMLWAAGKYNVCICSGLS